jgi:Holliday junction resolvasome RuvABC endonuclease subunit
MAVTGYGKATKDQVTDMVCKLVKLDVKTKLDDEYDAIGIALTHLACAKYDSLR